METLLYPTVKEKKQSYIQTFPIRNLTKKV